MEFLKFNKGDFTWKLVTIILAVALLIIAIGVLVYFFGVGKQTAGDFIDNLLKKIS